MADYQQYLAILDLEPNNAQALAALERMAAASDGGAGGLAEPAAAQALELARKVHRDRGELELVARLFDVELAAARDKTRRADLLFEKGRLLADEFLNEDAAVECFQRVLELRPDDENAQEVLAHIGLVRENWEKIVKKYLDEAKVSTDRQLTTSLYLSVAETYARYRREGPEVEQFLRRALEVEPRNRRAATHLERLLRNTGRWEELATFLEGRVDAAAAKEERVQALLGLADLAKTRLGRPQLAIDAMKKVLAIDPAHPRAMQVLVEGYSVEENWQALVKLYEGALKARRGAPPNGPDGELAMALQIAMLYWKRLKQMDAAEEYFRRVRKVEPAHEAMLEFYRGYHKDRGEGGKLLQLLQTAQKAEPDPARKSALAVEMASLADEVGNPEKAIDSWKAILRQDPLQHGPVARGALKRLYQRTEKWNALLELLKEEIEAISVDSDIGKAARVERLLEVVAIYRDRLSLDVMVINTYNNILSLAPDHGAALDALAAKYEQLGRWNDLTNILQKKADAPSTDREAKVALLRRIAALWTDRFGNHAQAVKPLEDLLALAPGDAEAGGKLKDIYTKRRQWRALLDLLGREAGMLPPEQRRAHLADMASLASEKLGDTRVSIAIWNRILEEDDTDALALASLASLYEREKRWLALAEIYHRQRDAVGGEDPRAAAAILERLGTLYSEKLEAPAQAAAAFQEILVLSPGHTKALRILRELYAQAGDLDALERLYGGLSAWDELVEVFHGVAERAPENDKKLAILERAAKTATEKLGSDKAAKAHERLLMIDPHHLGAARALVPIYRKGEKWARLLSTYEVLLAHAHTKEDKLVLHLEIRKLCEEKIGSKAMAFQWASAAYELAPYGPEGEQLLRDLERLGAEADAWERVAEILKKRVESPDVADPEKLRLLRELGRIRNVRLHQADEARAAWDHVLKLAPDDPEAMNALEEIATHQSRWPDLLVIYRRRAELEGEVAKKQEMLFKIAFIEEERVKDLEAAAASYQQIVALDPRSHRALRALGKVQHTRGDAAGLAQTLERELEQTTEADARVAILLRVGALYEEKLGERKKAVARYTAALALQGANRQVHTALERFLAAASDERVEVARLLVPVYERAEDSSKLAVALEILRSAEKDPAPQLALDRRLIVLYAKKLKDPLNAYEVATRVLALAPEDEDNRRELGVFAGELSAFDDLVNHLEKALAAAPEKGLDPAAQRELAAELAELYDEKLSKPVPAEAAWRRVLDLDASDVRAYDAIERLLRGAGRWDDLREVLERREQNTPDQAKRKDILLQLCDLHEGVLDNSAGAAEAYRRILDIDPAALRAYKALERLYDGAGKWAELEELIGREIPHVPSGAVGMREQVVLVYRRAELRAEKLADKHGAVDLAEEVLGKDPQFVQARKLLEALFPTAELRLRIARLLGPLYEKDELWKDLVRMLRGEREFAGHAGDASALLARIAVIQEERLADEQGAFQSWIEALRVDPDEKRAREQAERLARKLDKWGEAAAAWEEAIAKAPDGDLALRAALYSEVAHIYDQALGDPARATKAYQALLEVDPGNLEAVRPAAAALERLHDEQEAWPDLIDILRRQADWPAEDGGPEKRMACFYRVARIQEEKLADVPAALVTWKDVLNEDGENVAALDALERLHAGRGEARDLVDILRKRAELTKEQAGRKGYLARVAELQERELKDTAEATTAYLEILDFVPEDRATLTELARLYRAGERWADLLEIDERRLGLATDPGTAGSAEREALRFELGELLRDRLSRVEEALERFREILAEAPDHAEARAAVERLLDHDDLRLRAADVLQPIYAGGGDHVRLVGLYELEAKHLDDPRERLVRLRKIAQHREHDLADKDGAFDAWARACREGVAEPEFKDLLAHLTRIATERGRIADLVKIYRDLAPDVLDAELQRRIYLDIADLARGQLKDLDVAREYYKRVIDANPDDPRALEALEMLYRETQDHGALREILARKSERSETDLDGRRDALVEIAVLCEEKLGAGDEAVGAWEQVLELNAGDNDASRALERLYTERERWSELAELYEKRLGFAEDLAEAVELRFRLGELFEKQLTDPDRAVENYEAALGGDPHHARSIVALERYLDDPAARLSVAEVLEPLYISRQDWPSLIRITEIRLDSEQDPAQRLGLTKRIARLYEESLEDFEGAFKWHGKVFREDPADRAPRDQLVRLATILDKWDGLALIYQGFLDDESGDADHVRDIAKAAAEIYDRRLNDIERARAAYRRVLSSNAQDEQTFQALEAMLTRAQRWFALIESYEEGIEAAVDPNRRKDLHARIARVQESRLTAPDKAVDAYRAIHDIDLDDEGASAQLDRLYQELKRWRDLAELYTTRIDRASNGQAAPAEAHAWRVRLAEVLEQKLDDTSSGIDQYEQVVVVDPGHAAAINALERLVVNADYKQRIAQILEPIYRKHDWWQKLVIILDAQLEYVDDQGRRIESLREISRLHETRGGNRDLALSALARAWKEDVSSEDVYFDLYRLAEKLAAWERLVDTLDAGVEGIYDYDLAARILSRIGQVEEEKRQRRPAAIAAYKRVLEVKEDDAGALDALERLYQFERHFEPLVHVLERKVELASEVMDKKELLYRVAELNEQALVRRDAAVATWKQILSLDEEDAAALDALERLYTSGKEFRALVEILQRKVELTQDPAARRPFHFAAAQVYDVEIKDAFEAIGQYKAVLDAEPNDAEALERLDVIYLREKNWQDLVEILDRRAELAAPAAGGAADASRQADLLHRAAVVVEKENVEPEQAIERYRRILELLPRHAPTRDSLDALTRNEDTLEVAADVLEPVYKADYLHDKLAELHERRLARKGDDPGRRRERFAMLAETHEQGRRDVNAAFATWARFLREEPEDTGAQQELERLAQARGAWKELAGLYEGILKETMDGQLQRAYAMKLAAVYEEALGDFDSAAARYKQALDAGGEEGPPLGALDRIYEREGKWAELAEVLAREAQAVNDAEEQASFLYRLGDVKERALRDPAAAVGAYREVLDRVPTHQAARAALERLIGNPGERAAVIAILEPLFEQEADHARLADLLEQKLTVEDSANERAALLGRIADLAEKQLHDKVRALDAVGRWLAEDPTAENAATELERLAGELKRWEEAAARLADVIEEESGLGPRTGARSADVQRDLSLRLGRILFGELRDAARAEAPYRRVLELEARHEGALEALEAVCRALGDPKKLADVLWQRAESEMDAGAKRKHFAEVGRLREVQLGDDAGAVTAWKSVLDLEEGDAEAHVALAALYERGRQWEELVTTLELRARFAPDKGAEGTARRRIAEVLATELEALDRAVDAWVAVADLAPDDDSALHALAGVHQQKGDWLAVQETLARRLALQETGKQKIAIYQELVRIAEVERKSVDEAGGYLLQILEIDNANGDAYAALERLYAATERWHDLIEVLVRHGDVKGTLGDADAEIGMLAKAADVWESKLGNADAAAEILEKILKRDPRYVPALTRLARIYEAASDWTRCELVLERALALGPTGKDAADLYFRLGKVAEAKGGDPLKAADLALGSYEKALSYDGSHVEAIGALEKAARERGDFVTVAGLLTRRASLETDTAKRLAAALELADLYRTRLNQPAAAVPHLEAASRLAPDDTAILDALADLYFAAGRAADAEPIYKKLADKAKAARKSKDVAKYQQRLGGLAEAAGNVAGALAAYEEAFRVDATAGATMAGLGRIYFGQGEWEKARRVYRSMLLQNLDAAVGVSKADVYLHLGLIHVKLNEGPKAKSMYERGLELEPNHAGLREALAGVK